jgi:hypothetical protein
MLRAIRREGSRVVKEKWGIGEGGLRMYVHYQPSYCEFFVFLKDSGQILMNRSFPRTYDKFKPEWKHGNGCWTSTPIG